MSRHLIIVTGSFIQGGFERRLKYLVEWLETHQPEVEVSLFYQSGMGPFRPNVKKTKLVYWPSHLFDRLKLTFVQDLLFYVLVKMVSRGGPATIFFGHQSLMVGLSRNQRILNDNKLRLAFCLVNNLQHSPYEKQVMGSLLNCDMVVFNSKRNMADLVQKLNGLPAIYIPNQIETVSKRSRNNQKRKECLSLVACGNFSPQKNFDLLIPLAQALALQYPELKITVFASGIGSEEFQLKAKKANVESIEVINSADFKSFVADFDLFLLPSIFEGYPNALLEAQLAGVPSVAFRINYGPDEIINSGVSGQLVEDMSVDAFLDGVLTVVGELEAFKEGAAAHAKMLARKHSTMNTVGTLSKIF